MDDTKMLQAILKGQEPLKQELVGEINKVEQNLGGKIDSLSNEFHIFRKDITRRVDRLGKSLAYLEDDTPTREEFDKLAKRVDKIEKQSTTN
jgi:hypothetical protein